MPGINGRLSLEQLDSLEQWARVLIEDDDEDEAGQQLLALLRERTELAELVLRDQDGQLRVLVQTQLDMEKLEHLNHANVKKLREAEAHGEKYRRENIELKRQLEGHGALLKKVETLLNIARTRIEDGEDPAQVAKVADGMFKAEAEKPRLFLEKVLKQTKVGT
jgi:hypothetical protein